MRDVADAGEGVVVYINGHQGRGSSMADQLADYAQQGELCAASSSDDKTLSPSPAPASQVDVRDFAVAAQMLQWLGMACVGLGPRSDALAPTLLSSFGIDVVENHVSSNGSKPVVAGAAASVVEQ